MHSACSVSGINESISTHTLIFSFSECEHTSRLTHRPGQRRKEHLRNLERAEQERASNHADEMERLRQEINELRSENENLRLSVSPSAASPSVAMTSSPSSIPNSPFPVLDTSDPQPPAGYGRAFSDVLVPTIESQAGSSIRAHGPTSSNASEQVDTSFCLLFPQSIATVRHDLHKRLAAVLDVNVLSHPQRHLSTLAALGPSLPSSLQPTPLQLRTPHHAYIDLIPSPTLRDTLIHAGFETANAFLTAACTFVYEAEDLGQLTIWGQDYFNEMSWEFSEEVLKAWPNVLTAEWRDRANFWRRQRNEPLIKFD